MLKNLFACVLLCCLATAGFAQSPGILKGSVADESGAVIPGAKVTASGPGGVVKSAISIADGTYTLTGLALGDWSVQASSPGLVQAQASKVTIKGGTQVLNLVLQVEASKQEVTVQEQSNNQVDVDPSNNAGALVLKGEDLDALSDDPDDLEQDLQALAGPAAGPNGGQIYIDGFTGGRLPPKESIREIRINQNPFSSEYDRLGFGRIEILTRPGTDKMRGQVYFNISDGLFNSRNPFLTGTPGVPFDMPGFQTRNYGGNLSGPLSKKASFFLDFERREIDDAAVINARVLNPASLAEEVYAPAAPTSQRRTTLSPRLDYALNQNNTLMARYTYTQNDLAAAGIGSFSLPDRAYPQSLTSQTGQLTETSVINSKWVNETRFQVQNEALTQNGNQAVNLTVPGAGAYACGGLNTDNANAGLLPTISVSGAFSCGGSGIGNSSNFQRHYELQNYTSTSFGAHSIKFGVRVRTVQETDVLDRNFGGTWAFSGATDVNTGVALQSIDLYRNALLQLAGMPLQNGEGSYLPSQFTVNVGNPAASISQTDIGFFFQDDWRVKPNFTLSLGGRYETQTNIHDYSDFAPRLGFAWAPGSKTTGSLFSRPKLVFRGGFGIFYDRVADTLPLLINHYGNGALTSVTASDPTVLAELFSYFPNTPPASLLSQLPAQSTINYQLDQNLHAPYVAQSAIGVERQIFKNTSLAVTFTNTRGVHELVLRDINAPFPGSFSNPLAQLSYVPGAPNTCLAGGSSICRPYGDVGQIYNYESDGILNQNQIIVNVNTRISNKISMFGGYFYNHSLSDSTYGGGSASLPMNDYDISAEYGRSNFDTRHRGVIAGSLATKWDIRLSPFIILNTGGPFDIISPELAGNNSFNLRPAFAAPGTPVCSGGITASQNCAIEFQGHLLDPYPYLPNGQLKSGETIIPHNYGQSPGSVTVNLRLSKTWGFGPERGTGASNGGGFGGGGGPHGGGHGGGPGGMGMGGGMHGMFGGSGGASSRRYQLTLSVNARNMLNHTNYGPINGLLGSPTFGTSTTLAGGFGAETSPLNNRRLEFQLRFAF